MSIPVSEAELRLRWVRLPGAFNVRDVGGYHTTEGQRVRRRTLLRGDALHGLTEAGLAVLASYGLRTALDLREAGEQLALPDQVPPGVRVVGLPLFGELAAGAGASGPAVDLPTTLEEAYHLLVDHRGPALTQAVRELAQPGALPALVHCTVGKDRTGIVVALVLAALGVPDEVIAADYAATSLFLDEDFRRRLLRQALPADVGEELVEAMLACGPELIVGVLGRIRSAHGDVVAYLRHHGASGEELESLRAGLLESVLDGAGPPADP